MTAYAGVASATVPLMYSYMKFKIYKAWGKNKDFFLPL